MTGFRTAFVRALRELRASVRALFAAPITSVAESLGSYKSLRATLCAEHYLISDEIDALNAQVAALKVLRDKSDKKAVATLVKFSRFPRQECQTDFDRDVAAERKARKANAAENA